jgi:hypothetical protein
MSWALPYRGHAGSLQPNMLSFVVNYSFLSECATLLL